MVEPELDERDYLRQVELLALDVVARARDEGWQTYGDDPAEATGLQKTVNELARVLRHYHFKGDACLQDDGPVLHLGGAALITPEQDWYRTGCTHLGVEERPEGWALWYTWNDRQQAYTMVTTALQTTRALLDNWARGRDVHPAQPPRSQVIAVVRRWIGPVTLSPSHADTVGLGGR